MRTNLYRGITVAISALLGGLDQPRHLTVCQVLAGA
jgi:hypothetical protein